jgi:predicted dithiol-disulfide oxidoreductase (DUF899 family)
VAGKNEKEQEKHMDRKAEGMQHRKGDLGMTKSPIVSRQEWEAAHQQMLVKEKALTRARDALAAERRRMPWMAVEKMYEFEGPQGKVSLLDLFEGRRQLIVYRAFFEPGVFGWPERACRGCSLGADQVADLAHLFSACVRPMQRGPYSCRSCNPWRNQGSRKDDTSQ